MIRTLWLLPLILLLPIFCQGDILRMRDGSVYRGVVEVRDGKRYLNTGREMIEIGPLDRLEQETYSESWLHVARALAEDGKVEPAREAMAKVESGTRGYSIVNLLIEGAERQAAAERQAQRLEREEARRQAAKQAGANSLSAVTITMGCLGLLLLIFILFIPAFIAYQTNHPHRDAIIVMNVIVGWTIGGWVLLLAWSLVRFIPVVIVGDTRSSNGFGEESAPTNRTEERK